MAHTAEVARTFEALGAGGIWACDHVFWPGPCLEPMLALTVAATATEHVALGTCIVQLPLRRANVVAKEAATLQSLSRGRFVLGVGVGSHPGEYEQAGVDYTTRGRALDAGILELRRSWEAASRPRGGTEPIGAARYVQAPQTAPVPIWVGGSSEAALRRAARLGDGWMPLFLSVGEYGAALERLAKEVDRAGRAPDAVTPSMVLFVSVDGDAARARARGSAWMASLYGIPAKAFDRHLVAGTADEVAATVASYREAGAEHVVLYVTADEPVAQFEQLSSAMAVASSATRG